MFPSSGSRTFLSLQNFQVPSMGILPVNVSILAQTFRDTGGIPVTLRRTIDTRLFDVACRIQRR